MQSLKKLWQKKNKSNCAGYLPVCLCFIFCPSLFLLCISDTHTYQWPLLGFCCSWLCWYLPVATLPFLPSNRTWVSLEWQYAQLRKLISQPPLQLGVVMWHGSGQWDVHGKCWMELQESSLKGGKTVSFSFFLRECSFSIGSKSRSSMYEERLNGETEELGP